MIGVLWLAVAAAAPAPSSAVGELAVAEARRLGVPPDVALDPTVFRFAGGDRVSLEARVAGWPVLGRTPMVALDPQGRMQRSRIEGSWRRVSAPLLVSEGAAVAVAEGVTAQLGVGSLWPTRSERAWFAGPAGLHPGWAVHASTASPPATWRVFVDATTGAVRSTERTSFGAEGRIYPTSPALSEVEVVTLQNLVSAQVLDGTLAQARSCDGPELGETALEASVCTLHTPHAVADAAGNFLFDPMPGSVLDPFAEVHAYHHVDLVSTWMIERFGLQLPYAPVRTLVNFELRNAFFGDFDGDGIPDLSFGHDGHTGIDYAYDADVVYHEFGHAVVSELAPSLAFIQADGWGMEWVSGSVHEGAADGWAMLLTGDPWLGEYAGGIGGRPAVRDLQALRRCPDDLQGEVHVDGEILGSLVWAFIDHPDIGADVAAELLFGATALWGAQLDWPRVGTAFVDTSDDLLASAAVDATTHAAVLDVLEASGIESCGRSIPLDDGREVDLFVPTVGLQGDLAELPGGVQLTVEVPADALSLTVRVPRFDGPAGMGWVVHGRVGERIRHRFTEVDALGLGFATAAEYDWRIDGDGPETMVLTVDGEPPLRLGETLFLSVASRNTGTLAPLDFTFGRIALAADVRRVVQPVAADGKPPWSCGVETGATPGWGWLLLGLVACRRRPRGIAARVIACERTR